MSNGPFRCRFPLCRVEFKYEKSLKQHEINHVLQQEELRKARLECPTQLPVTVSSDQDSSTIGSPANMATRAETNMNVGSTGS